MKQAMVLAVILLVVLLAVGAALDMLSPVHIMMYFLFLWPFAESGRVRRL